MSNKIFIITFLAFTICDEIISLKLPGELPGILRRDLISTRASWNYPEKECKSGMVGQIICSSCTEHKVCLAPGLASSSYPCRSDMAYCNQKVSGDVCNHNPDQNLRECNQYAVQPIDCLGTEGYFPDPRRCTFYHRCFNSFGKSSVFECPSGFNFNPQSFYCRTESAQECMTVQCNTETIFSPYGDGENRYYAHCDKYDANKISLFACRAGYKMDYIANRCELTCPNTGNFCDKQNFAVYHECIIGQNGNLRSRTIECPPGSLFNLSTRDCTAADLAAKTHRSPNSYPSCWYSV